MTSKNTRRKTNIGPPVASIPASIFEIARSEDRLPADWEEFHGVGGHWFPLRAFAQNQQEPQASSVAQTQFSIQAHLEMDMKSHFEENKFRKVI